MIGVGQMYCANHKIISYGIDGYTIPKTYAHPHTILRPKNDNPAKEEQKKREPKKGHYLEDHIKVHGGLPAPGLYNCPDNNWPSKSKHSTKKILPKKKTTYIDEIVDREKKEKRPAPGQYKLFKDEKEIKAEKKRLAHRKTSHTDRITYLDAVQYEATMTPGVGAYHYPLSRPKSATLLPKGKQPNISRPISAVKKKQRGTSLGGYYPLFGSQHKSFARKKKGYSEWGKVQRFKSSGGDVKPGPGAYIRGQEDRGVSKLSSKRIYY